MRGKEMLDAVGYVDEMLILKAETVRKKTSPKRWIAVAACLCLIIGVISLMRSGHFAERDFIAQIEAIPMINDSPLYASFASLDEMIETTHANLIIRCTVSQRGDCVVYDPWGNCTEDDLHTDTTSASAALKCLSTPYTLKTKDCYLGSLAVGDEITFYAPYGILDGAAYRKAGAPILGVGGEYILFLRAEEIYGEMVYTLSYTPDSVYVIEHPSDNSTAMAETSLFYHYRDDVSALESYLRALIAQNAYSTEIKVFPSSEK